MLPDIILRYKNMDVSTLQKYISFVEIKLY